MNNEVEEREVLIADLPNGFEKEQLSKFCSGPLTSHIHVIAKRGRRGDDRAAYSGWPDAAHLSEADKHNVDCLYYATHYHNPFDVLAHGDKLSECVAACLFPEWASKYSYRS